MLSSDDSEWERPWRSRGRRPGARGCVYGAGVVTLRVWVPPGQGEESKSLLPPRKNLLEIGSNCRSPGPGPKDCELVLGGALKLPQLCLVLGAKMTISSTNCPGLPNLIAGDRLGPSYLIFHLDVEAGPRGWSSCWNLPVAPRGSGPQMTTPHTTPCCNPRAWGQGGGGPLQGCV